MPGGDRDRRILALGAAAAALWVVLALRWFDVGAPWRPFWLDALPPPATAAAPAGPIPQFARPWTDFFAQEA